MLTADQIHELTDRDTSLIGLRARMAASEIMARRTLAEGRMDAHMMYGCRYHEVADQILKLTGIEPRPTEGEV